MSSICNEELINGLEPIKKFSIGNFLINHFSSGTKLDRQSPAFIKGKELQYFSVSNGAYNDEISVASFDELIIKHTPGFTNEDYIIKSQMLSQKLKKIPTAKERNFFTIPILKDVSNFEKKWKKEIEAFTVTDELLPRKRMRREPVNIYAFLKYLEAEKMYITQRLLDSCADMNEKAADLIYKFYLTRGLLHEELTLIKLEDCPLKYDINLRRIATSKPPPIDTFIYSVEQENLYKIANDFFQNDDQVFECLRIEGRAGTGKTFAINLLLRNFKDEIAIVYSTLKGQLVNEFAEEFPKCYCMVVCQLWLTLFNLSYLRHYLPLQKIVNSISIEELTELTMEIPYEYINFSKFLLKFNIPSRPLIIYIDEYSLLSPNEIHFFKLIFKRIASHPLKILLLFAGDGNQLPPIFNVHIKPIELVTTVIIPKAVTFVTQQRNTVAKFQKLLDRILSLNEVFAKQEISNYFKNIINNREILFNFPVECLSDYPVLEIIDDVTNYEKFIETADTYLCNKKKYIYWYRNTIKNQKEILQWWKKHRERFINVSYVFLSKTNATVNMMNIKFAFSIFNQIQDASISSIDGLITFINILFATKFTHVYKELTEVEEEQIQILPYTPLIIGAPYILTETFGSFRKGEIFYLIGYCCKNEVVYLINRQNQELMLKPRLHSTNYYGSSQTANKLNQLSLYYLRKYIEVYNFPIQLAFAQTIFSSQGLTFESNKHVYLDLQNCSFKEMYVAISRAKTEDQIKGILIN